MTTIVLKRIVFHSCGKFKFPFKSNEYFLSSSSRLYEKKKFKIKNEFTFQDEFQQKLDKMYSEKGRLVSSELLLNPNKKRTYSEDKTTPKKRLSKNLKTPLRYRGEILFGIHPVYLALSQKKRTFYNLYIRKEADLSLKKGISRKQEIIQKAESMNIPILDVDNRGLKILAPDTVHQGVCLDAGFLPVPAWNEEHSECQVPEEKMPLWIVLDEILDPMNVGAIIRSAYFFGVDKVFTVLGNSCKLSPTVSKASSGVLEVINIQQIENLEYFVMNRKFNGWCIVSTLTYCEEKTDFHKPPISAVNFIISKPTIFILGNESRGISKKVLNLCNSLIFIEPGQNLLPGIDSLNVSVAAGILCYVLNNSKNVRR